MKNLKKDNKGFSLVELIVVVLIMAIIAVALAPQVMKWVENSRITADQNTAGNLKAAAQAGFADFQAHNNKLSAATSYTIGTNGKVTGGDTTLGPFIDSAIGGEKYEVKYGTNGYHINVSVDGAVTITGYDALTATLK